MKLAPIFGVLCLCIGVKAGRTGTQEAKPEASQGPIKDVQAACITGRPDAALVTRYYEPWLQGSEVIAAVFSDGLVVMSDDQAYGGPPFRAWDLDDVDTAALVGHVEEAIGKGKSSVAMHSAYRVTSVRSESGTATLMWDGQTGRSGLDQVVTAWEEVTALLEGRIKGKSPEEFWPDVRIKWVPQRNGVVESYSESGHLQTRGYWYDGLRNGKAKMYDANGNFAEEGWFRDGLREGLWTDSTFGPTKKVRYHLGERVDK